MDTKHRKPPTHASYRLHRRQVAAQIILPVVVAALLFIGAIVLVSMGAASGSGDVSRWAAISTIWLVLPVLLIALILLAVLIGIIYAISLASGAIPPYTRKAQVFVTQIEAGVKRGAQFTRKPMLLVPEIGHLIRRTVSRLREG